EECCAHALRLAGLGAEAWPATGRTESLPAVPVVSASSLSAPSARAPTVEPSSHAVVSAALVEPSACATTEAISVETPALKAGPSAKTVSPAYEAVSVITRASIESRTAVETRPPIVAAEPRARSDENAADEVVRAVIAVGRTGVRVVAIITIGTDRGRAYVSRAHSNTDNDSLCLGERCRT